MYWVLLIVGSFVSFVIAEDSAPTATKKDASASPTPKKQESTATNPVKDPPIKPKVLRRWWKAAGELKMGKAAYRIDDLTYNDGLCTVSFKDGIMIPVYTGQAPVSKRMIGMIYVGDGELSVRFPDRADAWGFANHMVRQGGKSLEEMAPIANQQKPYKVKIDRGLLLSADPAIPKLIYNLKPVGAGMYYSKKKSGDVDATYIVTDSKGKFRAKLVATNVLADRADQLERIGIDPRAMLRQDRLLYEELQFPGHHLRVIADFRTTDRYHVAAQEGRVVSGMGFDRWLTCYRDGRDEANTGFRAMVFSQGVDSDKRRHFQRFSGRRFLGVNEGDAPRPPIRMDPVFAESSIEFKPLRRGAEQLVTVDSKIQVKAVGAPLQYIAMQLPTSGARRGSWNMEKIGMENGDKVAWAGLNANLTSLGLFRNRNLGLEQEVDRSTQIALNADTSSIENNTSTTDAATSDPSAVEQSNGSIGGGASLGQVESVDKIQPEADPLQKTQMPQSGSNDAQGLENMRLANAEQPFTYKILVLLPEVIPAGKTATLRLKWSAVWPYGIIYTNGQQVRTAGTTTSLRPYLPELLPSPGGTRWNFKTTISAPARYNFFRSQSIAASGKTQKAWQDEGLWNWLQVEGESAMRPSVGMGRWKTYMDPAAKGLPAVRINLFPNTASYARMFPAEIRRTIVFLQKFLPKFPQNEIELFQEASTNTLTINTRARPLSRHSVIGLERISVGGIGRVGRVRDDSSNAAQAQIASQIASQYWGQLIVPNSERDNWLSHVISDAYATYYVRAALGLKEYEKKIEKLRQRLENPEELSFSGAIANWKKADAKRRFYSLTGSTPYSDVPKRLRQDYGLYVFSEMLRLRIGNQAFFTGLDLLAKERQKQRVTSEHVQQALEKVSGQDLNDFFDFWIHGGYIPNISLQYRISEGKLFGCFQTDVPFGRFDLPVQITSNGKQQKNINAFVNIRNGVGTVEAELKDSDAKVTIDPLGLILAYSRKVKKISGATDCLTDPLKKQE